ncbi:MAG: response regulator [Kofleriaceae bacterium]
MVSLSGGLVTRRTRANMFDEDHHLPLAAWSPDSQNARMCGWRIGEHRRINATMSKVLVVPGTEQTNVAPSYRLARGTIDLPRRRRHVLLVEDERSQAEGLAEMLREEGFSVAIAPAIPQALAAARVFRPDLVLVDMRLGTTSGVSCVQQLRFEHGDIPTILTTGLPTEHPDVDFAVQQYHCRVVTKPLDFDVLLSVMTRVLE